MEIKIGEKYRYKDILKVSELEEQPDGRVKAWFTKGTWQYTHDIPFFLEKIIELPKEE